MEYSNPEKDKIVNIIQDIMNRIDTNTNYNNNYENFLRMYAAIRKLKTKEPDLKFKVSNISTNENNHSSRKRFESRISTNLLKCQIKNN
jgi:uncharacterized protein YutD